MTTLALYHYDGCGHCSRVRHAMGGLGVLLEERNILADPEHRKELVEATGRSTVPVLRIVHDDGHVEWLGQSRAIIAYLRERFADKYPDEEPAFAANFDWMSAVPWLLLIGGGLAPDPVRQGLWTAACMTMAYRSFGFARGGATHHRVMAFAFSAAGVFIALEGLGVTSISWWYGVYGLVAALLLVRLVRPVSG